MRDPRQQNMPTTLQAVGATFSLQVKLLIPVLLVLDKISKYFLELCVVYVLVGEFIEIV